MTFIEKALSVLRDPKRLLQYGRYCSSRLLLGNGAVKIPQNVRIYTSSFSEYLSVLGLMPGESELGMFQRFIPQAKVVFDLGANVGAWTVLMSKANPQARVHSFEPNPEAFAFLKKNVQKNDCANVVLNCAAVSDAAGHLRFQIPENASIFCRVEPEAGGRDDDGRYTTVHSVLVPSVRLGDYCEANSIHQIDFMKIDVEGYELAALRGLEPLLSEHRVKAIYIETCKANHDRMGTRFFELLEFIRDCGYNFHTLSRNGGPESLVPIAHLKAHNHLCLPG
jgi:FkbM family methyltransferase